MEQWEEGMETNLPKNMIQYRIQWEIKEMDAKFLTPTKQWQMSLRSPVTPPSTHTHIHKTSKRKSWKNSLYEKFIEKILDMVNQNVQDSCKKFQDTKNKNHQNIQKQVNELWEDFNKHQSETKDTIKKKYELKMTTQNIKEDLNKDMENLRKKNQTEILGRKSPFSQTNNTANGRPLQHTRISGRQNLRAQR
jgi:hypothetical protein